MFVDDFVLFPDRYLLPAYKISPFTTADIARNRSLSPSDSIDDYFHQRFAGRRFVYCESGRQAIHLAMQHLGLAGQDVVTILTTTSNLYISGCVTQEIGKFCRWSRQIEAETKAILVNHEFGLPFENLRALRDRNVPMIEDAAHCFASENAEQSVSRVGDFVVYSFPKFFPIQFGGLLVFDERYPIKETLALPAKRYLQKVLSAHIDALASTCRKRQDNYRGLASRFETIGCSPRFALTERAVPGVFMFKTAERADLPRLKTFMWEHGIECSVFYGEQSFFIPVHDRLQPDDLDYLFEVARTGLRADAQLCGHRQ